MVSAGPGWAPWRAGGRVRARPGTAGGLGCIAARSPREAPWLPSLRRDWACPPPGAGGLGPWTTLAGDAGCGVAQEFPAAGPGSPRWIVPPRCPYPGFSRPPRCPGPAAARPRSQEQVPRAAAAQAIPLSLSPFAGHSDGPAGWVWLGGLQPRPLRLLHPLDHRTALHRQRPWDPPVFPASGIRGYHPRGGRAAAAAIYRYFHNVRHVEEQETCQEIRLKAQLGR